MYNRTVLSCSYLPNKYNLNTFPFLSRQLVHSSPAPWTPIPTSFSGLQTWRPRTLHLSTRQPCLAANQLTNCLCLCLIVSTLHFVQSVIGVYSHCQALFCVSATSGFALCLPKMALILSPL